MYKKTIAFIDYDGNEREEDFYFNLSEAEVIEMETAIPGGLTKMMQRIVKAQDGKMIIETFKELIKRSYGVKSPDGREFDKSPEVVKKFMQTEAYSKLFMELATDSKAAGEFFNHIIPQKLLGEQQAPATPNLVPLT